MKKADLIARVSQAVGMTQPESKIIVDTIFESIVKALHASDKVEIRGFGSFRTRHRQPRIGRNPKTGARVEVPSKTVAYFRLSKELKEMINSGKSKLQQEPSLTLSQGGLVLSRRKSRFLAEFTRSNAEGLGMTTRCGLHQL